MNFDPLFEDLEARFSAAESLSDKGPSIADLEGVTSIKVVLQNALRQTLIAPILGRGFVGGLDAEGPNWVGLPLKSIRSMSFSYEPDSGLPRLRFSKAGFEEHLQQLPLPARCSFRTLNSDDGLVTATLLDVDYGLLFLQFDQEQMMSPVPLVQVTQLRIWAVDNSGKVL